MAAQVCVSVFNGRLATNRNVTVVLQSIDLSAMGKCVSVSMVGNDYPFDRLGHLL